MQIAASKTKLMLMICIMNTSMFITAFEVSFLSIYYPENMFGAGLFFIFLASISACMSWYYFFKATKEDKLSEGL